MADDYGNDSTTAASIVIGGQVSGRIEQPGDEDWFAVVLEAGTTYLFDLRGADGGGGTLGAGSAEARLDLYDPQGQLQHSTLNGGTGDDPLLSFVPEVSGTYYLGVGDLHDAATGTYTLRATVSPLVDDFGGTTATGGSLAIGGRVSGSIEQPGDEDWFAVVLLAGTTYLFDLRGADGGGGTLGAGSAEARLDLYDPQGHLEHSAIGGGTGDDPLLSFVPVASGTYFLGVGDLHDASTGTYTLRATVSPLVDDFAGSTATSGSLAIGGQVSGRIEQPGDEDWFVVVLQAGTTYLFDLRGADGGGGTLGAGSAEARLDLYDPQGQLQHSTLNGGTGDDPLLSFVPAVSGTYYLGVGDLHDAATGTYTLRADAGDTTAPFVVGVSPARGGSGLPVDTRFAITFSEPIQRGTGVVVLATAAGSVVATYDAAASADLCLAGSTLLLDLSGDLAAGTGYRVEIAAGVVRDLAGNPSLVAETFGFETAVQTLAGTSQADHLVGTAGKDDIAGLGGDDLLEGGSGDDRLDGGPGVDVALYRSARAGATITRTDAGFVVSSLPDGTDALTGVERLRFSDVGLALDLEGHAGTVARILGALFGPRSLADREYVGIGLDLLDRGMSDQDLVASALRTDAFVTLAGSTSHADFVERVYENVIGVAPSPSELEGFVALLDSGIHTQASLARLASDSEQNLIRIDWVGLTDTGIEYMPAVWG